MKKILLCAIAALTQACGDSQNIPGGDFGQMAGGGAAGQGGTQVILPPTSTYTANVSIIYTELAENYGYQGERVAGEFNRILGNSKIPHRIALASEKTIPETPEGIGASRVMAALRMRHSYAFVEPVLEAADDITVYATGPGEVGSELAGGKSYRGMAASHNGYVWMHSYSLVSNATFYHELGHVFGCKHDDDSGRIMSKSSSHAETFSKECAAIILNNFERVSQINE